MSWSRPAPDTVDHPDRKLPVVPRLACSADDQLGVLLNAAQNIQNLGSYPWVLTPVIGVLVAVMSFNMPATVCATPSIRTSTEARARWTPSSKATSSKSQLSVRFKLDDAVRRCRRERFVPRRPRPDAGAGRRIRRGKSVTARAIIKLLPRTATVRRKAR